MHRNIAIGVEKSIIAFVPVQLLPTELSGKDESEAPALWKCILLDDNQGDTVVIGTSSSKLSYRVSFPVMGFL